MYHNNNGDNNDDDDDDDDIMSWSHLQRNRLYLPSRERGDPLSKLSSNNEEE